MYPCSYPDKRVFLGFILIRAMIGIFLVLFIYDKNTSTTDIVDNQIIRKYYLNVTQLIIST